MKKILFSTILLLVMNTYAASTMVCTSTHSKNYEVTHQVVQSGEVILTLHRFHPFSETIFDEGDFQDTLSSDGIVYERYAYKKVGANLYAKLDVSTVESKVTHIFLTLKNNLSEWNEPVRCR